MIQQQGGQQGDSYFDTNASGQQMVSVDRALRCRASYVCSHRQLASDSQAQPGSQTQGFAQYAGFGGGMPILLQQQQQQVT